MRTITVEIINEKALKLLKNLEQLQLIRLHRKKPVKTDWIKYKGTMHKQSLHEIDDQLKELRNAWQ